MNVEDFLDTKRLISENPEIAAYNKPSSLYKELETFVRRSSAHVAKALGIANRGELKVGADADIVVLDPATVRERSTYESPELLAEGMQYVLVNGVVAIGNGKLTGTLAGRGLKRAQP